MILWFAGVSFVFVWWVFKSPALDYRPVSYTHLTLPTNREV